MAISSGTRGETSTRASASLRCARLIASNSSASTRSNWTMTIGPTIATTGPIRTTTVLVVCPPPSGYRSTHLVTETVAPCRRSGASAADLGPVVMRRARRADTGRASNGHRSRTGARGTSPRVRPPDPAQSVRRCRPWLTPSTHTAHGRSSSSPASRSSRRPQRPSKNSRSNSEIGERVGRHPRRRPPTSLHHRTLDPTRTNVHHLNSYTSGPSTSVAAATATASMSGAYDNERV